MHQQQTKWGAHPRLLNTPNGTIDLRTGKMRAHQPKDYLTKTTAVGPSTDDCPKWKAHLNRILNADAELIAYVQRMLGYSLTGVTTEHALFFCYGTGANGKGALINTIAGILKDYAQTASVETFTARRNDRHATELAVLRGARLVTVPETEEGRRWAESKIKQLTGGDPMRANFMRQDTFDLCRS
jgi:putative DNA primase/helicase